MPAIKWLRPLLNHIPDKHVNLVRYYGHYSNRTRGARRLVESANEPAGPIRIDEPPAGRRRKASWARLIQKVYEVDPLECGNCGADMRIIALVDDACVVDGILKHLDARDPQPDTLIPAGPAGCPERARIHAATAPPVLPAPATGSSGRAPCPAP